MLRAPHDDSVDVIRKEAMDPEELAWSPCFRETRETREDFMNINLLRIVWASALCGSILFSPGVVSASRCEPDGTQASGSIYRICTPDPQDYNNRLVIWAHGFQDATEPVGIPEDQLQARGHSIQAFFNDLGFGFATNSYSKTGLAVRQAMDDILDLVRIYTAAHGTPNKIYLTGASEGGLITTLLVEQRPDVFAGGLAACGPVGDFAAQINYFSDARATFEYFFPTLIPGDPFHPTQDLIAQWDNFYAAQVRQSLLAPDNRAALNQWVRVAKLPFDPKKVPATKEATAKGVLGYAVLNLNDAADTLGGFPFGNRGRRYSGSADNADLNAGVPRIGAESKAIAELQAHYNTSGQLDKPLITLHSTRDSLVPYRQETLYIAKTKASGDFGRQHFNIQTSRYGHCQFTQGEVLFAVATLFLSTGETSIVDKVASTLEASLRREFRKLARNNGIRITLSRKRIRIKI